MILTCGVVVSSLDPLAYAVAVFSLLVLTALASYAPARRAAKTDPVLALRAD